MNFQCKTSAILTRIILFYYSIEFSKLSLPKRTFPRGNFRSIALFRGKELATCKKIMYLCSPLSLWYFTFTVFSSASYSKKFLLIYTKNKYKGFGTLPVVHDSSYLSIFTCFDNSCNLIYQTPIWFAQTSLDDRLHQDEMAVDICGGSIFGFGCSNRKYWQFEMERIFITSFNVFKYHVR